MEFLLILFILPVIKDAPESSDEEDETDSDAEDNANLDNEHEDGNGNGSEENSKSGDESSSNDEGENVASGDSSDSDIFSDNNKPPVNVTETSNDSIVTKSQKRPSTDESMDVADNGKRPSKLMKCNTGSPRPSTSASEVTARQEAEASSSDTSSSENDSITGNSAVPEDPHDNVTEYQARTNQPESQESYASAVTDGKHIRYLVLAWLFA